MVGGRNWSGALGAGIASSLSSLLWIVTVLSILEWSAAPVRSADFPQVQSGQTLAAAFAPAGAPFEPTARAQLPPSPAIADKRPSTTAGWPKAGPDGTPSAAPSVLPLWGVGTGLSYASPPSKTLSGSVLAHAGARAPPRSA